MSQQFSKKPKKNNVLLQISRQINEFNNSILHFPTFPGPFSPNIEKFRQITGGLKIGDRAQIQ